MVRVRDKALSIACPERTCGAQPGQACVDLRTSPLRRVHRAHPHPWRVDRLRGIEADESFESEVRAIVDRERRDARAASSVRALALFGAALAPIVPLLCARQLVEAPIIQRPGRVQ